MRVALVGANAQAGDALGNQLAEKLLFFLERGADVRVFVESLHRLHPLVRPHCHAVDVKALEPQIWNFLAEADLVIADYSQYYSLLELLPLLAGGRPRIVLDYHGVTPVHLWTAHNRAGLEQGARQRGLVWYADAALVHSQFAARELLGPTGFPKERVGKIGYAVEIEPFKSGEDAKLRADLGLENASLLLFVGRLAPNKRLPVLVEALAHLRERVPAVHAIVIGDSADIYETELRRCRAHAADLGVQDRLHFLGHVDDERLRAAYRAADVFVMPSRHEGFCIPVVEAMASGLPVVAARAGALPETVGDSGLTFEPDDSADLARLIGRVLDHNGQDLPSAASLRLAVVSCRHGADFAGGAETSLRTIAKALARAGHQVAVYTTTLRDLDGSSSQHDEGTESVGARAVHRFKPDAFDPGIRQATALAIEQAAGAVAPEVEREYITHSLRSQRLLQALREQIGQLDAVIVGPYLYGLTHDVATTFPNKTVLLPCFHDEAQARLLAFRSAYQNVGAILYHSTEEQAFADIDLGLNHPGATTIGTHLTVDPPGNAQRGRELIGSGKRYLVYCGRYSVHKELPLLLEYARHYAAERPGRFTMVFMGEGAVPIPVEPWARDLGFVSSEVRRDVIAGADALVQLSRRESLSLVALEAWANAVPVVANADCSVLAGQIGRSGGGRTVDSYEAFAAVLDELWQQPSSTVALGRSGQAYVRQTYGDEKAFVGRIETALRGLALPLAEQMRRRGPSRAERFRRAGWREAFARLVEEWLHAPERSLIEKVELQPRTTGRTVRAGSEAILLPVRVVNRGSHPLLAEGAAGVVIRSWAADADDQPADGRILGTSLPDMLLPGRAVTVAVTVPVPATAGSYRIRFRLERPWADSENQRGPSLPARFSRIIPVEATVPLTVDANAGASRPLGPSADVQAALVAAARLQRLPDDYNDVTQGRLARWKKWIKGKLLNNFKRAYVDELSHQQSEFNRQLLTIVQELAEGNAALWGKLERQEIEAAKRDDISDHAARSSTLPERMPQ